jgi:hypothetical protein
MADPGVVVDELATEAIAWFDDVLTAGEWINESWIGRVGTSEMRVVDVMSGDGRHRLLCRVKPLDDGIWRWDDLDYDETQAHLDEIKAIAADRDIILWAFAGPVTSLPARLAPEVDPPDPAGAS